MNVFATGLAGEIRAARYARRLGMHILKRRYRAAHGEIDLVARDGQTLVFIEVKTRLCGQIGEGARAVTTEKQRRLRFAAACYLQSHPTDDLRFDVIEISAAGLRHIKSAF